jgi:3-oxoacyl-[acyl-carrier-protein] synthase I
MVYIGAHNIISPLGFSSKENFKAVLEDKTALAKRKFDFSESTFCCAKIDPKKLDEEFSMIGNVLEYTSLEKMSILSIKDVIDQSGVDLSNKNTLLILSTTKGNIDVLENPSDQFAEERAYLSSFTKKISGFFNCANASMTVSNACISGLLAIIMGKRLIESQQYENIIICGADLVTEFTLSGFKSFNALSEEPCKPFDANRTGINLGEAASSVLLSRNKVSNIIISAGASANDANHISGPSRTGEGLYEAISKILEEKKPDFISAHGTATEFNDEMESVAFHRTDLTDVPVNSLKGYYGHTLGAAGLLETVLSLQSLAENQLIPSKGFETQGVTHHLNIIQTSKKQPLHSFMKTASGFGGCNAAAIFEKI